MSLLAHFSYGEKKSVKTAGLVYLLHLLAVLLLPMVISPMEKISLLVILLPYSAAFCMAVYTIIGTLIRRKTSTIVYTTLVYTSSAITVFIAATFYHLSLFSWGMKNLSLGLCLAVICTLMGHSIFSWALKYLNASFVSTAKLLEPVFASVLGLLIFKEIPQVNTIIGGLIIIIGIWYYSKVSQNSHQ